MNPLTRFFARIGTVVLFGITISGCSPFFPPKPPVSVGQARSIVTNDGYQIVTIGITINRPVDAKTFYGICKDTKGSEYAYSIDTKTKSVRTIQLGGNGYPTYEQMNQRLLKQGQKLTDVQKYLTLMLSANDTFYWQYSITGGTWNLKGEPYTVKNP